MRQAVLVPSSCCQAKCSSCLIFIEVKSSRSLSPQGDPWIRKGPFRALPLYRRQLWALILSFPAPHWPLHSHKQLPVRPPPALWLLFHTCGVNLAFLAIEPPLAKPAVLLECSESSAGKEPRWIALTLQNNPHLVLKPSPPFQNNLYKIVISIHSYYCTDLTRIIGSNLKIDLIAL